MMMMIIVRLALQFELIGLVMIFGVPDVHSDVVYVDSPAADTVDSLRMTLATSVDDVSVLESNQPICFAGHNWKDKIQNCGLIPLDTVRMSK
jgi:hypothetical protein